MKYLRHCLVVIPLILLMWGLLSGAVFVGIGPVVFVPTVAGVEERVYDLSIASDTQAVCGEMFNETAASIADQEDLPGSPDTYECNDGSSTGLMRTNYSGTPSTVTVAWGGTITKALDVEQGINKWDWASWTSGVGQIDTNTRSLTTRIVFQGSSDFSGAGNTDWAGWMQPQPRDASDPALWEFVSTTVAQYPADLVSDGWGTNHRLFLEGSSTGSWRGDISAIDYNSTRASYTTITVTNTVGTLVDETYTDGGVGCFQNCPRNKFYIPGLSNFSGQVTEAAAIFPTEYEYGKLNHYMGGWTDANKNFDDPVSGQLTLDYCHLPAADDVGPCWLEIGYFGDLLVGSAVKMCITIGLATGYSDTQCTVEADMRTCGGSTNCLLDSTPGGWDLYHSAGDFVHSFEYRGTLRVGMLAALMSKAVDEKIGAPCDEIPVFCP